MHRFIPGLLLVASAAFKAAMATDCVSETPDGPIFVTADCVDPLYSQPVIDTQTFVDSISGAPHHVYAGHFEGDSGITFNIYLPSPSAWTGRFFQNVYPTNTRNASDDTVAFGVHSGAYTVQISGTSGYRADAAAAKFSREVAADFYGYDSDDDKHIYGYIYGASGGSFQTEGAIENTQGVWDGGMPIVQAVPVSLPNNLNARALGYVALKGKADAIQEALRPGGSGDVPAVLDETETGVWTELARLGLPTQAWEGFDEVTNPDSMMLLNYLVKDVDPAYVDDFYALPGYLGTEASALGDLFRAAVVDINTTIATVQVDDADVPISVTLDGLPSSSVNPTGLEFNLYDDGNSTQVAVDGTLSGSTLTLSPSANAESVLASLVPGAPLRVDNRWFLALATYHRHQVPSRSGFYGYDQFRLSTGSPSDDNTDTTIYPQRAVEVAPQLALSTSGGGTHSGLVRFPTFVFEGLLDVDAYPWHADWYRTQVLNAVADGDEEVLDTVFRVYFNEHMDHGSVHERGAIDARIVENFGAVNHALLYLSRWVEEGVSPPPSTNYTVPAAAAAGGAGGAGAEAQVLVPRTAAERLGMQPIVVLSASEAEVGVGQEVAFEVAVDMPPGTDGMAVVSYEWDFLGVGDFGETGQAATASYVYSEAGTYVAVVRVASRVDGVSELASVLNLGRVSVVVK